MSGHESAAFRAVIFDMDGTITRPYLDFRKIREEIGLDLEEPVLEKMMQMEDGPERRRAFAVLERYEREAVRASQLNDGAREVLAFLAGRGIPAGLVTRNSRRSAEATLVKHGLRFEVVVTREDAPPKPSPEPLLQIGRRLDVAPEATLVVGDFKYDIMAGRAAGMRTCLLTNRRPPRFSVESDYTIEKLGDLVPLLK
ncbi:MAG: HAD family hydrolase [Planctomycetota bacterium]|jgi:HAD superfamily hydrolase (TIGR01509 family)